MLDCTFNDFIKRLCLVFVNLFGFCQPYACLSRLALRSNACRVMPVRCCSAWMRPSGQASLIQGTSAIPPKTLIKSSSYILSGIKASILLDLKNIPPLTVGEHLRTSLYTRFSKPYILEMHRIGFYFIYWVSE